MKKLTIILSLCISVQVLTAQQSINPNIYTQNLFMFNPGATGANTQIHAFLHHINTGIDLADAPQNLIFGAHGTVGENVGLGGMVSANQFGIFESQQALFAYSYKIKLGETNALRFGVSAGVQRFFLNTSSLKVQDASDLNLDAGLYNTTGMFAGFGLNLKLQNFNLDLAIPNLYDMASAQALQVMAGNVSYNIFAANKKLLIQPSAFVKMEKNSPLMLDANLYMAYNENIWLQAGYRHTRGIMAGAGVAIKGIGVGYAYGYNTGMLAELAGASHEITISFRRTKN